MKFEAELFVVGMKASKGTMESGLSYDSTKVYALVDMDDSKGTMKGQAGAEYALGEASEFEKYKHLPFPFRAKADMEIVTNGKTARTVVRALRPISDQKLQPKPAG